MKNIAVVLSGCGVFDGSEIHEAVLTLLAIDKAGARYQCLAPDIKQRRVFNHASNEAVPGAERNVLQEAARIARGKIIALDKANPSDYDAVIFPGGLGAALNLSDFAENSAATTVQKDVLAFAKAFAKAGKPAGFLCIAPVLINQIYGEGVKLTIGNDAKTAQALERAGAKHVACTVHDIVVDEPHKVVTTPAYMLAQSLVELHSGIEKLVQKVIAMA